MRASIVRIGNSRGVRIPKPVIEQCGFGSRVEMTVAGRSLVIRAARRPREGWAEACKAMAAAGDDAPLLSEETPNEWDNAEWIW